MSIVNTLALESNRQIKINFDGGDLSSDAGLLLIKEFISKLGIDTLLEKAFKTSDPALFRYHSDPKNLLQMILLWSSFFVTLVAKKIVLINLCCRPCFIWGSITIITVWTNMIIINVCKFFYLLIECFLCCKLIQICAFYSGSVVKTKIQAFYNEPISVAELGRCPR